MGGSVGVTADNRSASEGRRADKGAELTDERNIDGFFVEMEALGESISEA